MKLRNTKNQIVRIRLPKQRVNLEILPLQVISIDMKTRQAIIPYLNSFGLKVEADDEDFHPNATLPNSQSSTKGGENVFHRKPVEVNDENEPTYEEMEELLFTKGVEETGQTAEEEPRTSEESAQGTRDGVSMGQTGPPTVESYQEEEEDQLNEEVSGVFGKDTSITEERDVEELTGVPEQCPYTRSELTMRTKAELWERCEKLGLDSNGTKKEIVERIIGFYKV